MSYQKRIGILMGVDTLIILFSVSSSYFFRFDGNIPSVYMNQLYWNMIITTIVCLIFMHVFKLYNRIWEYASVGEIVSIFKAVTLGCVISFALVPVFTSDSVPISIVLRSFQTTLLLIGLSRFAWRIFRDSVMKSGPTKHNVLIIGAGSCGTIVARELMQKRDSVQIVGFIDDDPNKQKLQLGSIPILGDRNTIPSQVEKLDVNEIILSIPSASKKVISEIILICKPTKAKVKIIPSIQDLINGKVSLQTIRDVQVEDLLGRDPVAVDLNAIAGYMNNKVVLVTGAGGSIGSELCRQISLYGPKQLLLLGHGENSIHTIELELTRKFSRLNIETIIADVQDRERLEEVFAKYKPHVVFHAAAHKHVPLMERNPQEAIKNNVFGTKNVAECAHQYKAERFVLISTDKAVNPTSIMGATKRIAEMYIQTLGKTSQTKFAAVRFGNVLGSRGSVIPRFKEQIAYGGPVTVTHPEMIRYFMTIPEAVQLVIQSGAFAEAGEIYILDMGEPVKILDLAISLIQLSGFEPYQDIEIEFTGIRQGEKLFEELLTNEEGLTATKHNRIYVGQPSEISLQELEFKLRRLEQVIVEDQSELRGTIKHIVPTFENVS